MHLVRTTAPASTVVDLATLKAHLRITHSAEDALVTTLAAVVDERLDGPNGMLRRALVTQTWKAVYRDFPVDTAAPWRLPLPPLQSVTSIKYRNTAGTETTVSSALYHVIVPFGAAGYVELVDGQTWPSDVADRPDAVTVEFVAGYGIASAVPTPIRQAALLLAGELYANRGDVEAAPLPAHAAYIATAHGAAAEALLSRYKWREMA